jgi:uncharacterized SAM-binding protein YcdF (DUF218 family)
MIALAWLKQHLSPARIGRALGTVALATIAAAFAVAPWLDRSPISLAGPADAIVELAGEAPARVLVSIDLYRQGRAPELWITGDVIPAGHTMSVAFSDADLARVRGVPVTRQHLLATTSTWEDGAQVAAAAQSHGATRLLLVTSWYHGRRAICVLRHHLAPIGVTIGYVPAESAEISRDGWWCHMRGWLAVLRELLAIPYYWLRYGVSPLGC